MAQQARTALSAIMLGALAGSGELPFPRAAYEETIRRFGRGTNASLTGFGHGYAQLAEVRDSSAEGERCACSRASAANSRRVLIPR